MEEQEISLSKYFRVVTPGLSNELTKVVECEMIPKNKVPLYYGNAHNH